MIEGLDQLDTRKIFTVSISSYAINKDGYKKNKFEFGNSFFPKEHNMTTLCRDLAIEGYAMIANFKRDCVPDTAVERGCSTFRVTENFIGTAVIPLDDDGELKDKTEKYWRNNAFFSKYGAFCYHTHSSKPSHQKVRPVFILEDHVIRTPEEYNELMKAIKMLAYPQIDSLVDCTRVTYGSKGASGWVNGKFLPYQVVVDEILTPYRDFIAKRDTHLDMVRINRIAEIRNSRTQPKNVNESYAKALIDGYVRWLGELSSGGNVTRNGRLYCAGRWAASGMNTRWMQPYQHLLYDVRDRVCTAFVQNGYNDDYGNGTKELERIFDRGYGRGGDEWDEPLIDDSWFAFEKGDMVKVVVDNDTMYGKISARKRPRTNDGKIYSAYQINGESTLYAETNISYSGASMTVNDIQPPLLPIQREQVEILLSQAKWEGYLDGLSQVNHPNMPDELLKYFNIGFVNETDDDGIVTSGYTVPLIWQDGIINTEFNDITAVAYENNELSPLFMPEGYLGSNIVLFSDCLDALAAHALGEIVIDGVRYVAAGLPSVKLLPESLSVFDNVIFFRSPHRLLTSNLHQYRSLFETFNICDSFLRPSLIDDFRMDDLLTIISDKVY